MANSSVDRVRKLIDNRMADLSTDPTKKIAMDELKELRESINDYDERTKRFEFQSFIYVILELVRHSLKPNLKTVFTVDLYNNSKVADDPMLLLSDDDFSTIRESISALDRTNNLHVFAVLSFHKLAKFWLQDQDPTDDHRKSTTTTYLKDIISEIDTKMLEIKTNADQDESDEESKSDEEQDVDYDERIKQIEHETFIDDMLELFRHSLNPNLKTKFKNYLIYNSNVCEDPITLLSDKDFSSIRESISALDRTNNLHRIAVLSFRKLAKLWLHDRVQDPTDYNIKNLQDLISDIDTKLLEIRSRQTEQKEPTQSKSNVEQEQIKSNADQDDSDEESDEEESDEEMLVFHSRQTEQKELTQSKSNVEQEQIKSNADQDDSNEESDEEMLEIHSRQTEQKEPTQSKSNVEQEQVKSNADQDDSNEESDENLQSGIKMNCKAKEVEMSCKRRADNRIAEKPDSMNLNQASQSEPDSPPFFDTKGSDNGCSDQNCEKPLSVGMYESSSLKRSSTAGKGNLKDSKPHFLSESSASENKDLMRDLKRQKNLTNGDGIVRHSTSYHNKLVDPRCDLEIKSDKVTGALVPSHAPSDLYPSTDICSFCQSSKLSEATGSMLHYASGISVAGEAAMQPNVVHVHKVCIDWAPQVYFVGETVKNLKAEVARGAKIKCTKCGKKGAALGCFVKSCRRTYHVPCAMDISACRWDHVDYLLLCPRHSNVKFPNEKSNLNKQATQKHPVSSHLPSQQSNQLGAFLDDGKKMVFCGSALSNEEKKLETNEEELSYRKQFRKSDEEQEEKSSVLRSSKFEHDGGDARGEDAMIC